MGCCEGFKKELIGVRRELKELEPNVLNRILEKYKLVNKIKLHDI